MADRVYHWKHGWIPLDHVAADTSWHPVELVGDDTPVGKAAAAKVRQAFKRGDTTVLIETPMTKAQTGALLSDVADVTALAEGTGPVTVHVPAGDKKFTRRKGRINGAYVRDGQATIFLNPKLANGSIDNDPKTRELVEKQLMPGARDVTYRRWTIAHELGHINDFHHTHTFERTKLGSVDFNAPREDAAKHFRDHQGYGQPGVSELSQYGKSNAKEGYAEVFAQFLLGDRSPIVESYVKRYGWKRH